MTLKEHLGPYWAPDMLQETQAISAYARAGTEARAAATRTAKTCRGTATIDRLRARASAGPHLLWGRWPLQRVPSLSHGCVRASRSGQALW